MEILKLLPTILGRRRITKWFSSKLWPFSFITLVWGNLFLSIMLIYKYPWAWPFTHQTQIILHSSASALQQNKFIMMRMVCVYLYKVCRRTQYYSSCTLLKWIFFFLFIRLKIIKYFWFLFFFVIVTSLSIYFMLLLWNFLKTTSTYTSQLRTT